MPTTFVPPSPQRTRRSRFERRVTVALKVVLLLVVGAIALTGTLDFLGRIRAATSIVIGAIFFTYLVAPLVRRLRAQMPLGAAIAVVYIAIVGLIAGFFAFIAPVLSNDVQSLVRRLPEIQRNAQDIVTNPANPIFRHLPSQVSVYVETVPSQIGTLAQQYGGRAAQGALGIALSAVGVVATVVVIPVMSAYMMIEGEGWRRAALRLVPARNRPDVLAVGRDLDRVLGGFVRGQILVGAVIGACITVVLLVTHVRYAVLIGVSAGVLNVIPYVGSIAAFVPSVTIAYFTDGWQHALLVAALLVAIFQLDGHFITPKIVSDSVGLSPLMVIVAILVGGELLGVGGMFLAVPAAAMLRVLVLRVAPAEAVPASVNASPAKKGQP